MPQPPKPPTETWLTHRHLARPTATGVAAGDRPGVEVDAEVAELDGGEPQAAAGPLQRPGVDQPREHPRFVAAVRDPGGEDPAVARHPGLVRRPVGPGAGAERRPLGLVGVEGEQVAGEPVGAGVDVGEPGGVTFVAVVHGEHQRDAVGGAAERDRHRVEPHRGGGHPQPLLAVRGADHEVGRAVADVLEGDGVGAAVEVEVQLGRLTHPDRRRDLREQQRDAVTLPVGARTAARAVLAGGDAQLRQRLRGQHPVDQPPGPHVRDVAVGHLVAHAVGGVARDGPRRVERAVREPARRREQHRDPVVDLAVQEETVAQGRPLGLRDVDEVVADEVDHGEARAVATDEARLTGPEVEHHLAAAVAVGVDGPEDAVVVATHVDQAVRRRAGAAEVDLQTQPGRGEAVTVGAHPQRVGRAVTVEVDPVALGHRPLGAHVGRRGRRGRRDHAGAGPRRVGRCRAGGDGVVDERCRDRRRRGGGHQGHGQRAPPAHPQGHDARRPAGTRGGGVAQHVRLHLLGPSSQRGHQALLHVGAHRAPSSCCRADSSASSARLAVDLTVPREIPSVVAISASVRSDQ